MPAKAQAQPQPAPQFEEANLFQLKSGTLSITFTARDFAGRPQLSYKDGQRSQTYTGDQIQQEETGLGLLLTVSLVTVDVIQRLTVVLPKVLVELGKPEKIATFVVFQNRGPVVRPPHSGQEETYSVKTVRGTASLVLT